MTEVEIGIYTHRWSEWQVRCIESIARHTKSHQYSILMTQKTGNCHQNMNRLWRRFTAPYVIMLDEDVTILQDGWLESLIKGLESNDKIGVLGAMDIKFGLDIEGGIPEPSSPHYSSKSTINFKRWIPAYLMAFKLSRVPFLRFDEAIPGDMGMTDVDACCQIDTNGLLVAVNSEVLVYHPARDDDETRKKEQRPSRGWQELWYPAQVAYMQQKWGDLFERIRQR